MSEALARTNGTQLAQGHFDSEQVKIIKTTLCPGIDDAQLALFGQVCKRTGLDPFARQIYATLRNTREGERWVKKMTIQTGIDGFRLIAERTGKYAGQGDFEWFDGEKWVDVPITDAVCARATVYRSDFKAPLRRIARFEAYVQTNKDGKPNSMWERMGPEQLAKCAEALALRTAFPQELSGIYSSDEMAQADSEGTTQRVARPTQIAPSAGAKSETHQSTEAESSSATDGTTTSKTPIRASGEDGPRFPVKWSTEYGGRLMTEVPERVLSEYISDLDALLADGELKGKAYDATEAALEKAREVYSRVLAEEQMRAAGYPDKRDRAAAVDEKLGELYEKKNQQGGAFDEGGNWVEGP